MDKILSRGQAQAVSQAMAVLANIGGLLHTRILAEGMTIHVQEYLTEEINVWRGDRPGNPVGGVERYVNRKDFFDAYGI